MRWGRRKHQPREHHQEEEELEKKSFSFSHLLPPFSWLSKLRTTKPKTRPKSPASTPASCIPRRPSPARPTPPPSPSPNQAHFSIPDAPRRLSLDNDDNAGPCRRRRCHVLGPRHFSLGGDLDLPPPPLGDLIPFSRVSPPEPPAPETSSSACSDTDEPCRHRRRLRRRKGRRSFYGKIPPKVRSPRRGELERYAVVRRTSDPQREFRESMVEMIAAAKGMGPEEMERLLACYLSLNADEHHDVIIKVFRQVWFEINYPGRRLSNGAAPCRRRRRRRA